MENEDVNTLNKKRCIAEHHPVWAADSHLSETTSDCAKRKIYFLQRKQDIRAFHLSFFEGSWIILGIHVLYLDLTNLRWKYSAGCAFKKVKIFIRFVVSNLFHPSFAKSKHPIEGHICISEMEGKLHRGKTPNQILNWSSKRFNRTT